MLQEFTATNDVDEDGLPAGGNVTSIGLSIEWQKGPLGEEGVDRLAPNGAFVETLIAAALQRIEWYQEVNDGKFECAENSFAIGHLRDALDELNERTKDRQARGVEGTHKA
ncbi:hypothetical protein LCGC14_1184370 [marine sediment metagenome]|uniref:Acb2/Tad1 hairpin domain-containing protein n=1 Tax=marine sediment metagenome TaxID=412755 RepID=A0A0F9P446_9ZZZZ